MDVEGWRMMRCTNQGEPVALGVHLEKREREREGERASTERGISARGWLLLFGHRARG